MIKVRAANRNDIPAIISFQLSMAMETEGLELDKPVLEQGVTAVFDDPSKGAYFIAEKDSEPVGGLMTTYEWSDWRNGTILWIQSVYVKKEHRKQGIYRKLYEHVKSLVLEQGSPYRGIRLYVDKTNVAAQQVYAKLGMNNHHYEMFEWMKEF